MVDKNIERHAEHTIVSWPFPKQWVIVDTSDFVIIIRKSIQISQSPIDDISRHLSTIRVLILLCIYTLIYFVKIGPISSLLMLMPIAPHSVFAILWMSGMNVYYTWERQFKVTLHATYWISCSISIGTPAIHSLVERSGVRVTTFVKLRPLISPLSKFSILSKCMLEFSITSIFDRCHRILRRHLPNMNVTFRRWPVLS